MQTELNSEQKKNGFKLTKKWTIGFIAVMLFFTFFSQTIYSFLTPKVKVESTKRGTIIEQETLKNIEVQYTDLISLKGDYTFESPLYIDKIVVTENQKVKAGETILKFEKEECEALERQLRYRIDEIKKEIETYKVQEQRIQLCYEEDLRDLERTSEEDVQAFEKYLTDKEEKEVEIAQYQEKVALDESLYAEGFISQKELEESRLMLDKAKKQLEAIEVTYQSLVKQQAQTKQDKAQEILEEKKEALFSLSNGKDIKLLEEDLSMAQENYDRAKGILLAQEIIAPIDGVVKDIVVKDGDTYDGRSMICSMIPETSDYRLMVKLSEEQEKLWKEDTQAYLLKDNSQYEIALGYVKEIDQELWGQFDLRDESIDLNTLDLETSTVSLKRQSQNYHAIIPRSALVGNKVYVLTEEEGFWGKEYYVSVKEVTAGENNVTSVGIVSGLEENQSVVVYWDRPLEQGQRVMIE